MNQAHSTTEKAWYWLERVSLADLIQNPLCGPLDFFNTTFLQMGYWTKNSFKTLFKLAGYSDLNCCLVLYQQCVCKPLNHVLNLSNSLLQGWLHLSILGTSTYYRLPPVYLAKYASPLCGYHHHFIRVFSKLYTWRSQPPKYERKRWDIWALSEE